MLKLRYLLAGLSFSLACGAQAPIADAERRNRHFDELITKAESGGTIRVMVSIRVDNWEPEATLAKRDVGLAEAQRTLIRQKQHNILGAIQVAIDHPEVRLYRVGAISVKVDARQLSILRDHPDVAFVAEPRATKPA